MDPNRSDNPNIKSDPLNKVWSYNFQSVNFRCISEFLIFLKKNELL